MADRGHEIVNGLIAELEKKFEDEYSQASKEVTEKLYDHYERFAKKDVKQKALLRSGKITPAEYQSWLYGQMCTGKRWTELKDRLTDDYLKANNTARQLIKDQLPEAYAVNRDYATYQVCHDAQIDVSYTLYNRDAVNRLIKDNPKLLPDPRPESKTAKMLMEHKDKVWNRQHINSAITQGVLQGESIPKIASRLQKVTDMNRSAAIRNARTMMTSAQNRGREDGYDDLRKKGVELREKWIATLDSRTRDSHRWLHGTYKDEAGYYANGLMYPGDPSGAPEEVYNCRCTEIAEVEGFNIDTPKYSPKLGTQTFEEWLYDKSKKSNGFTSKDGEKKAQEKILSNVLSGNYFDAISTPEPTQPVENNDTYTVPDTSEWINLIKANPDEDGMLEKEKEIFTLFTNEESKALTEYTGGTHSAMNTYLRNLAVGKDTSNTSEEIKELCKLCHSALDKCELKEAMVFRRGTDLGDIAGLFMRDGDFKENRRSLKDKTAEELNAMFMAKVGKYDGFTSTSSQWDSGFGGKVEMVIFAPPGTKAASIMTISQFGTGEGETLFRDDTTVLCRGIEASDGHFHSSIRAYIEVIPDNK